MVYYCGSAEQRARAVIGCSIERTRLEAQRRLELPTCFASAVAAYCVDSAFVFLSVFVRRQSEEYFVNKRGRVIHVRSYCPADVQAIRAVVLFSHG